MPAAPACSSTTPREPRPAGHSSTRRSSTSERATRSASGDSTRLGRSLPHLIQTAGELAGRDIALRSLTEQIDISGAGGRLIFHVFGALAEFERALIQERTHAGLAAARARGRKGGWRTVMTPQRLAAARSMPAATDDQGRELHTYDDVAKAIGVSHSTIVRHCG